MPERKLGSLRVRLLISMLFAALIPILVIDLIMYNRYLAIIQNNTKELTQANLSHIETSLDTWIDSYSDIMRQIDSDGDIKNMLAGYDKNMQNSMLKNDIRQKLRDFLQTKEYVMSITLVSEENDVFFYDRVTPFSYNPFWLHEYSMTLHEMYDIAAQNDGDTYFSTEYAKSGPNKKYYLFHMAHAVTYKTEYKEEKAVVIVSIDEQLLEKICNPSGYKRKDSVTFIVDGEGHVISYEESRYLSDYIGTSAQSYTDFVKSAGTLKEENLFSEVKNDKKLGWDIVNVSLANKYDAEISQIQQMVISMAIGSAVLVIIIVLITTRYLMSHVDRIARKMNLIENGDMSVRIETTSRMPTELATIADHLNNMLDQLEISMEKEKMLIEREKVAEIAALEARINPHFLYNTLDTINWMAIDNDEIEISNAISALGKILRYGINNSNGIVSIATEMEWLKQYIYLQQTRLKETFKFELDIEPQVMQYNIHKLLLQPFVENSIIHGFKNKQELHMLKITIKADETLNIIIEDNGVGMSRVQVESINAGHFQYNNEKYHVGMENAFQRLKMYYGENADVHIESEPGKGTIVYIRLPKDEEEK